MIASETGHVEVVDKLLVHGATADLQTKVRFSSVNSALQVRKNARNGKPITCLAHPITGQRNQP